MNILIPVKIKVIATKQWIDNSTKELNEKLSRYEKYLEKLRLEEIGQVNEIQIKTLESENKEITQIKEYFKSQKLAINQQKESVINKLKNILEVEEGAEVSQGEIYSLKEIKVGDSFEQNKTIVIKNGVIAEIRE